MSKIQKKQLNNEQTQQLVFQQSSMLFNGIVQIIDQSRRRVAVYLNTETTLMYWHVGNYINENLKENNKTIYGHQIIATLSQQLTGKYGKGFTYTALTRMSKVANTFNKDNIATLSQQLNWSHFIELSVIDNELKRAFYTQMNIFERWGVRELRDKIDKMLFERTVITKQPEELIQLAINEINERVVNPELVFKNSYVLDFLNLPNRYTESELEDAIISNIEKFILELGNGFAFVERQKRITVDSIDYHLDLLFYHRKLKRMVAIDLKLGRFKPKHKAQMELYLRWLEKYEMQDGELPPIGLLLCSEGNTEHIELLMLGQNEVKVAQYLTELPSKEWFADKLHKAKQILSNNSPETIL
jgi:predicted nuclease of restriction endonuclease-like (RecB) superfamily